MTFDQVSLDLETLGVKDGAAIISIGAVRFSLTEGLGESFHKKICLHSEDFGEIEGDTVGWWFAQEPEAIKEAFKPEGRVTLREALSYFEKFLSHGEVDGLWSKGPTFDEVLLRGAWARVDWGDFPIHFSKARDIRTAEMVAKALGTTLPVFEGLRHDALADAAHQAKIVIALWKDIGGLLKRFR